MFFKEFKDTSKNNIAEAAALLNRTPKRQGSNQYIIESVFDDDFKQHPNHRELLAKHPRELTDAEKKYVDEFHQRLYTDRRAKNPEKFAAHDKKEEKRKAELKANPFKSGLPKVDPFPTNSNWGG